MEVDHIFIFSKNQGREADDLIEFGLQEGSSRVHKGQGTANRKFYFENFFLEILWVVDDGEINRSPTSETHLNHRAKFYKNHASRFGLCLVNTKETDQLFRNADKYNPAYFPPDMSIDFLPHKNNQKLPWTFRLPYRGGKNKVNEPLNHSNHIKKLTRVEFGLENNRINSQFLSNFEKEEGIVHFSHKSPNSLILEFDNRNQNKEYSLKDLDLIIRY